MKQKTVLAVGADIKNRFLIGKGKSMRCGPDIGDLSDAKNFEFFKKEVSKAIKKVRPGIIAHDLHPGYFSTKFIKENSLKLKAYSLQLVQHHHAHIASVLEEHNLKKPVIGVAFDGTGFGTDKKLWGGEFLMVDTTGFKRLAHFRYMKMPGGEKAVTEPWRMVLSILERSGMSFARSAKTKEKELILSMMAKNINSPLTSSAGRLFDAASALLGICEKASYEAEGPIKLEAMCDNKIKGQYEFKVIKGNACDIIDTDGLFLGMIKDLEKGIKRRVIATKFHNSMAEIIIKTVEKLSKDTCIKDIALSGGVFQNKFLKIKVIKELTDSCFNVFTNVNSPVNDLNISLGQYHVSGSAGKS